MKPKENTEWFNQLPGGLRNPLKEYYSGLDYDDPEFYRKISTPDLLRIKNLGRKRLNLLVKTLKEKGIELDTSAETQRGIEYRKECFMREMKRLEKAFSQT